MDSAAIHGLYPQHRCKTLHWVRHAQGLHNLAGEKDRKNFYSYDYLDASLSPLGWEQVDKLRKHVQESGLSNKIELVITSPFTRTMQTAVGVFGGDSDPDGRTDATPLMVSDAANSGRPAISSLNSPPFLAVELCREDLGIQPCNKRRSKRLYESLFPALDFSLIESDEDTWWKEDVGETDKEVAARGKMFMKWLWTRKEKEIVIVSHYFFLLHTLSAFGDDCHQCVKDEICKGFANCELRSMVFVDKGGMISSDSPTANLPREIPKVLDLPAEKNASETA